MVSLDQNYIAKWPSTFAMEMLYWRNVVWRPAPMRIRVSQTCSQQTCNEFQSFVLPHFWQSAAPSKLVTKVSLVCWWLTIDYRLTWVNTRLHKSFCFFIVCCLKEIKSLWLQALFEATLANRNRITGLVDVAVPTCLCAQSWRKRLCGRVLLILASFDQSWPSYSSHRSIINSIKKIRVWNHYNFMQ